MSVKFTTIWTCDGCGTSKTIPNAEFLSAPPAWVKVTKDRPVAGTKFVGEISQRDYCAKCAKEKGL